MKFNGFGMIRSFQDYIETETLICVQHKLKAPEVPPTPLWRHYRPVHMQAKHTVGTFEYGSATYLFLKLYVITLIKVILYVSR